MIIFIIIIILILLDLPKFHSISYHGDCCLRGDNQPKRRMVINGFDSYDNTLIMRSTQYLSTSDENVDLPSLTKLRNRINTIGIYDNIGHVILESRQTDPVKSELMIVLDIPNLSRSNIDYAACSFGFTADLIAHSMY